MRNSTTDVQEMISAFHAYIEAETYDEKSSKNLLRYLLDRSTIPTYQNSLYEKTIMTDKKEAEIKEIQALVDIRRFYKELFELVTIYPPELLQQSIIVGMVVYLLRTNKMKLDNEGKELIEFYEGWGGVVLYFDGK